MVHSVAGVGNEHFNDLGLEPEASTGIKLTLVPNADQLVSGSQKSLATMVDLIDQGTENIVAKFGC